MLTHGTFDILHYGHVRYLKKAKSFGDYLIVSLSTNEYSKEWDKTVLNDYKERKEVLEAIKYVDLVIPQTKTDNLEDIENYDVNIFVDSEEYKQWNDYLKGHCKIIYLSKTPKISTSKIKKVVNNMTEEKKCYREKK